MNNRRKQENKASERLNKGFRAFSIISNILLAIGGVAMMSFVVWLIVELGGFLNIG